MKLLTAELVGYIKQRHLEQARKLASPPALGIVLAGQDSATLSFIRAKQRYGQDIGIAVRVETAQSVEDLLDQINFLNRDDRIKGLVVQLPLPPKFNPETILNQISSSKDVDGLTKLSKFEAPTAKGIMWLLGSQGVQLKTAHVAVVGQGRLVGQPVSKMLEDSGAIVERCDINTLDLAAKTKAADVIITGVGRANLITKDMVKEQAIVVDAGTTLADGELRGDVDPILYDDPTILVTPTPGGVGPLTVAALFDNLLIAAGT